MSSHISRSWNDAIYFTGVAENPLEVDCPCAKAPCGLVDSAGVVDECEQHSMLAAKTLRHSHDETQCPTVIGIHDLETIRQAPTVKGEAPYWILRCICGATMAYKYTAEEPSQSEVRSVRREHVQRRLGI